MTPKRLQVGATACGLAAMITATSVAMADQGTLSSTDGTMSIVGDFLDFAENTHTTRTAFEELRMSVDRVTCKGPGCPELASTNADLRFVGSDIAGRNVLPLEGDHSRALPDTTAGPRDGGAMRDMGRLTDDLKERSGGPQVLFVGFIDEVGGFDGNDALSAERAAQVPREMQAVSGSELPNLRMASMRFGEISPADYNSVDPGRTVNRRVEVWVSSNR